MLDPRRTHSSMQIRSLRIFCDVVRKRNFSAAASEHGLTQGAASQTVQHLEDLVDVKLLDRSTRPFLLTAEGQKFFDGATSILRNFDSLIEEVRGTAGDVSGNVSVGSIYSIGLSYLPGIEEQFKQRFPNATLQTQLAHPDAVYKAVEQGTVDLGLVSYPESTRTVLATAWREERMVLVSSPRHRLASRKSVCPKDLSEVGLVAFAKELPIRHAIDRALRAENVTMRIVVELDNIDSVKHAVVVNSGLGFLPELTVQQELAAGSLQLLRCPDFTLTRPIGYLQRRDKPMSRVARELAEFLARTAEPAPIVAEDGKIANRESKSRRGVATNASGTDKGSGKKKQLGTVSKPVRRKKSSSLVDQQGGAKDNEPSKSSRGKTIKPVPTI